jgi:DNA (cytosine-5)-methyltransferase 1
MGHTKSKETFSYLESERIGKYAHDDNERALLSHWLHLRLSRYGGVYEPFVRQMLSSSGLFDDLISFGSETRETCRQDFFPEIFDVPFPPPTHPRFSFIDLFAGIGGFRLAMQACGGECVFSSEWDKFAQQTYFANYGEVPFGDITLKATKDLIPQGVDIICAGFPCQAFSLAGKRMGFEDNYRGMSRGTLFRDVVEICETHRPKVVFCENVKGLLIHDKGRTFTIIKGAFEEIGYKVFHAVRNSMDFGVPQHRERIYIVAFRKDISPDGFDFPTGNGKTKTIRDILQKDVSAKYYLSETYVETLKRHKARHEAAGHGFGYVIRDLDGVSGAIVCGGMGRETNLIIDPPSKGRTLIPETNIKGKINKDGIRKMTPREWARLQGYPENFMLPLADTHLYKQFGNSVSVPVVTAIARAIVAQLGLEVSNG